VILPKQVTDDFYSTWTQCYEELFNASLSPKYVQRKDSTASSTTSTTFTSKADSATGWDKHSKKNGLQHSVSELNLASPCNDDFVPRGGARSRSNDKRMQRLSLDVSNMSFDGEYGFTPNKRPHQRHFSDSTDTDSRPMSASHDRSSLSKLFGVLNGRKKTYKLSNSSLHVDSS